MKNLSDVTNTNNPSVKKHYSRITYRRAVAILIRSSMSPDVHLKKKKKRKVERDNKLKKKKQKFLAQRIIKFRQYSTPTYIRVVCRLGGQVWV